MRRNLIVFMTGEYIALPFHVFPSKVAKIDLSRNRLEGIPGCLLELPCLNELNLSHNKLRDIPPVPLWSPALITLDLSHNDLTTLPGDPKATSLHTLNLSHNQLTSLPPCVCGFLALHWLDVSFNKNITTLPPHITNLDLLTHLNLNGLVNLREVPPCILTSTSDSIAYLRGKLCPRNAFNYLLVDVLGGRGCGKTSLAVALSNAGSSSSPVGAGVYQWSVGELTPRGVSFSCLLRDVIRGEEQGEELREAYYRLPQTSLYLLLFDLRVGRGALQLEVWLTRLARVSPGATVVIVGTYLDAFTPEQRPKALEQLKAAYELVRGHAPTLQIRNSLAVDVVSGENVLQLKQTILMHMEEQQTKGTFRTAPAPYQQLSCMLGVLRKQPGHGGGGGVMAEETFKQLVEQANKVQGVGEELERAVCFLEDMGTLACHQVSGFGGLYFLDSQWFPNVVSKLTRSQALNSLATSGLLQIKHITSLLETEGVPKQYFKPVLALLDQYDVAVTVDDDCVLLPSMLPNNHEDCTQPVVDGHPTYTRYILVNAAFIVAGYWGRLISSTIHLINHSIRPLGKCLLCESIPSVVPGHTSSGDPGHTSSSDPGHTSSSDPGHTSSSDPGHTSSSDPGHTFSGDPGHTSSGDGSSDGQSASFMDHQRSGVAGGLFGGVACAHVRVQWWRSGFMYQSPDLSFKVGLQQLPQEHARNDVISVSVSRNGTGKMVIGQLTDLILRLASDWYPDLLGMGKQRNTWAHHMSPCPLCVEQRSSSPFLFGAESCISHIGGTDDKDVIPCGNHSDHTLLLEDLFPDLVLTDVDRALHCKATEISYVNPQAAFGQGKLRDKPVSMRTYLSSRNVSLRDIRHDTLLLVKLRYPLVASVMGVCLHPLATLALESAPLGSLEGVLASRTHPLPRVVVYRVVWEVAVAMAHVHSKGVVLRDLNAASILVWSVDPESLCHCKLADLRAATPLTPSGARGIPPGCTPSKRKHEWVAPEVFTSDKAGGSASYDQRADIYSLGGVVQQLISEPQPTTMWEEVKRSSLQMAAFPYLAELVPRCHDASPARRPTLDEITRNVCRVPTISLVHVRPVDGPFSLRHACATVPTPLPPDSSASIGPSSLTPSSPCSCLSICCEGSSGLEVSSFAVDTMAAISKHFIENGQAQCMCPSEQQQLLVPSSGDLANGTIAVLDPEGRALPQTINIGDSPTSCMVCSGGIIYCGTVEGYCVTFLMGEPTNGSPQQCKFISNDAVVGLVVVEGNTLWVSCANTIHFLDLLTLEEVGVVSLETPECMYIGNLYVAPQGDIVWGAHLGGNCLSAWSATQRSHLFSVNMYDHMRHICSGYTEQDALMSALVPVLDTVWVGMATGHILVFHHQELLLWFHPYNRFVRFLVCVPGSGDPSSGRGTVVVSGGKEVRDIAGSSSYMCDQDGRQLGGAGALMLWEAQPTRLCRQMSMLEKEYSSPSSSSSTLTDLSKLKRLITSEEFKNDVPSLMCSMEARGPCSSHDEGPGSSHEGGPGSSHEGSHGSSQARGVHEGKHCSFPTPGEVDRGGVMLPDDVTLPDGSTDDQLSEEDSVCVLTTKLPSIEKNNSGV